MRFPIVVWISSLIITGVDRRLPVLGCRGKSREKTPLRRAWENSGENFENKSTAECNENAAEKFQLKSAKKSEKKSALMIK